MTTRFTDDLMEQGLTQKILTLVSHIDLNNEFDKLQRERGLGSEKHRKEVKFTQHGYSVLLSTLEQSWTAESFTFAQSLLLSEVTDAASQLINVQYQCGLHIGSCISILLLLPGAGACRIFSEEL